jgi:hypothetical protein
LNFFLKKVFKKVKLPTSENVRKFINDRKLVLNTSFGRSYLVNTHIFLIALSEFVVQKKKKKLEKIFIFFNTIVPII